MELQAKTRTILGKKVKSLRRQGFIPAELFGRNTENLHLSVPAKEFAKVYKMAGGNTIISLKTEDGKQIPVLISAVSNNPLNGGYLSVDFYAVHMNEKIKAKVPIVFTDIAPAIKNGFVVITVLKEIEIEALPLSIPHSFEVSLATLKMPGDSISVNDLKVPSGVKILAAGETVIATVTEKTKEEITTPAPQAPSAAKAAPAAPSEEIKAENAPPQN